MGAVRERSKIVTDKAIRNELKHFDVDMRKFPDVVTFVSQIIKVRVSLGALLQVSACPGTAHPHAIWVSK